MTTKTFLLAKNSLLKIFAPLFKSCFLYILTSYYRYLIRKNKTISPPLKFILLYTAFALVKIVIKKSTNGLRPLSPLLKLYIA